jgi:hypothetical protein
MAAINRDILQRVWQELEYKIGVCRVTSGGPIEHLMVGQKLRTSLLMLLRSLK